MKPLFPFAAALVVLVAAPYVYGLLRGIRWRRTVETSGLMREVVEHGFDAILTVGDDGRVQTFNAAAERLFGCSSADAVGRPLDEFVRTLGGEPGPEDGGPDASWEAGPPREVEGIRRDGTCFPAEMAASGFAHGGRRLRAVFLRDISERKAREARLEHRATHDPLTGLTNRFLLNRRLRDNLGAASRSGGHIAFLLLDFDRFKEINDTLGHPTGDALLRDISDRLRAQLQPAETLARLRGDEFALVLPDCDLEAARHRGLRLIEAFEKPFEVNGLSLHVLPNVGVSLFPEHGSDVKTLIRRADFALYVAKREETTLSVYDPSQDCSSVRHLVLRGDLRKAIDTGELFLVYQPQVFAQTGQVASLEALMRWSHPEHGPIPPDEFIRVAEHSGLMRPLTGWLLETSIRECARWNREGFRLGLSINVSAHNLLEDDLASRMEAILREHGLSPEHLILEITESVIMEAPQRALTIITELRSLGVAVAIDDFGTGYSSLGYLQKLPANELKIDKSFVMDMDRNRGNEIIVRSTIELAHNLGLEVVAEGVESKEVWQLLKSLGCDRCQGYYFSRPVPFDELRDDLLRPRSDAAVTEMVLRS